MEGRGKEGTGKGGRGGEEIDASGGGGCLHLSGGIIGPAQRNRQMKTDTLKYHEDNIIINRYISIARQHLNSAQQRL